MTKTTHFTLKKSITGTAVAAAILAGSSAHAQLMVQTFNDESVSGPDSLSFNVDPVQFFSDPTAVEFTIAPDTSAYPAPVTPKLFGGASTDFNTNISSMPLTGGATVDADSVGNTSAAVLNNGTSFYGLHLLTSDGFTSMDSYGYLEITQTGDGTVGYTDTINAIGYDPSGASVTIPGSAPEPSSASLLLSAAAGAAGLFLYRRNRRGAIAVS